MLRFRHAVGGSLLIASLFAMTPPVGANHEIPPPFPDMQRSWFRYAEAVDWLRMRGAIGGYPDGTFKPKATINRAELLKVVFQARGNAEPVQGEGCFSDVPADAWYAGYVCSASRRKIVNGYPDGTFKPEQPVNIAEAMKIVLLAYGRDIADRPGEAWYSAYANELEKNDVFPRHSYVPWEPLTRERAADLIARFIMFDEERESPRLSPGCGKVARDPVTTVTVGERERSFLLTIPDDYVHHDPSPLVVAFHGRTNDNERVRSYMKLDRELDDAFIAYPAALSNGNGTFSWSDAGDKGEGLRDVAFFDAIVETLSKNYCIDMDRIFVVGHSLGAWMANSVACVRGGVVRASATVGGDSMIAPCSGPSAAMIIHNPDDNLSPFSGSVRVRDARLEENACTQDFRDASPQSLKCVEYAACQGGNAVVFCPHEIDTDERGAYYPHTWPRDAASAIADFFAGFR